MSVICPNCQKSLNDGTKFCHFCGSKISVNSQYQQGGHYAGSGSNRQTTQFSGGGTYQKSVSYGGGSPIPQELMNQVVDSGERMIAFLGDSAVKTLVTGGGIGTNRIFFTDRRFYAKSNHFSLKKGIITNNLIVDLQEISGSSILHINPIGKLILAVLLFLAGVLFVDQGLPVPKGTGVVIGIILGVVFVISYFLKKGTYLRISYPGDSTDLSVKMYSYNKILEFHKKLRSAINE